LGGGGLMVPPYTWAIIVFLGPPSPPLILL
jgi:hypothetical protein